MFYIEHTNNDFNNKKTKPLLVLYIEHTNDLHMNPLSLDELKQ